MRRLFVCCITTGLALASGACSGAGARHSAEPVPHQSPCTLIAQLDATAASVAHADVSDPETFNRTLDHAVERYVTTVRALKRVTPPDLQPDLDRIEAAVHQYRFRDAVDARASLNSYAAAQCAPPAPAPNTTAPVG